MKKKFTKKNFFYIVNSKNKKIIFSASFFFDNKYIIIFKNRILRKISFLIFKILIWIIDEWKNQRLHFAYLLKLCLNDNLPENEDEFIDTLNLYFPNYYDIKILGNLTDNLKGGLNKIALQLGIQRFGDMHQAGSDSIITGNVFFKIKSMNLIEKNDFFNCKNILFGIGKGSNDDETYQYTLFYSDFNPYQFNHFNTFNNFNFSCNFNFNDKVFRFIKKNGNFDNKTFNQYPWNMVI